MIVKTIFVLRTCKKDGTSHNEFKWPKLGSVSCPDWDPKPECGHGLHGLAKGEGSYGLLNSENHSALWQVVEVSDTPKNLIHLTDGGSVKCKFNRGTVVYTGDKDIAVQMVKDRHPEAAVHFARVIVGNDQRALVGNGGTATAGDYGTASAGDYGTASAGERGTIQIKYYSGGRYRLVIGYVGEDGIEPNVAYVVNSKGKLVVKK